MNPYLSLVVVPAVVFQETSSAASVALALVALAAAQGELLARGACLDTVVPAERSVRRAFQGQLGQDRYSLRICVRRSAMAALPDRIR